MRLTKAERALAAVDPVMARLVAAHGPCTLRRRKVHDPFTALLRSIAAQMISGKALLYFYGLSLCVKRLVQLAGLRRDRR